jgi:putative spermidine/putrescine transport system ATP-binding protein
MSLAVRFQQVSRHYDAVRAVDQIDLAIAEGEFFSMLGPSGSGKTTSLRLIAGFEQPSSGSIQIFGREAAGLPPNLRDVNTVFQDYALFPHMSVLDNVAYGLMIKGVAAPSVTAVPKPCWRWSSWGSTAAAARRPCPVASVSAWRWHGR